MDRASFVAAARTAFELAATPEVASAWGRESACAGMTVGGLAHHLLQQAGNTARLLSTEPAGETPIPLIEHYARAAWVTSGHDDEPNVVIREAADAAASGGRDEVLATAAEDLERLPRLLAAERSPDQVHIPWQGWSLTTDDFLVTRAMEIVVHSDDLAVSVGVPPPEFPEDLATEVFRLLASVAARRHGQAAVVRALSRPQRAPGSVSAF